MTTEVIAQSLVANQQATFGQGRIWYVKAASAALTIIAERAGTNASVRKFVNIGAGFKFSADKGDGWTYLRIVSAVNQNIEIIIGDDDVEVANAVTVNGGVNTSETPAAAASNTPQATIANGTQGALFAASLTRKRVTVFVDSTNAASCYARTVGGANNIAELQPGASVQFTASYALEVRNDSGATANFYILEES